MATYNLIKVNRRYYVEGLADEWTDEPNTLLLARHPAGDCDTVARKGKLMHSALYDLRQCCDALKDGDVFALRGKPAYVCQGVHVVPVGEAL